MFKANFIKLCKERGEYPTVVCKKVGITPAAFSQWSDDTIPRKATVDNVAKYFGVTPEYLLGIKPIDLQHFAEPTSVDVAVEKFAASIQDAVRAAEEKKPPSMLERLADVVKSLPKDDLEELGRYAEYLANRKKG
jgi:hypothetical protein